MTPEQMRRDARNRAARALLQGALATVVVPALLAGLEVVRDALAVEPVDWHTIALHAASVALTTAIAAIITALSAYLHRLVLDPSAVPSLRPPSDGIDPPGKHATDRYPIAGP